MKSKTLLVYLVMVNIGLVATPLTESWERNLGTLLITLLSITIVFSLLATREIISIIAIRHGKQPQLKLLTNLILGLTTIMICICLTELGLLLYHQLAQPAERAMTSTLAIPEQWQRRDVEVENARFAYYWHGVLHVHDRRGMRRTSPFPAKNENIFRIMVVGDSLTYGYGVPETQAYPHLLQEMLSKSYRVEVLNLGICGNQSGDIKNILLELTPALVPNLIVYGISLNDFLPSGISQYSNNRSWPLPLPRSFKYRMSTQTYLGALLERAYDQLLMKIGVRSDFYDDILKDFQSYQTRFAHDLDYMNSWVVHNGLPPILAVVFHQQPVNGGRSHQIARIAEASAKKAGMTVIPTDEYFKEYSGQFLVVSKWEHHPSPEAHRMLAHMLLPEIERIPALKSFSLLPADGLRTGRVDEDQDS